MTKSPIPKYILPIIIFAQFAGTSLWFAGNAILFDLQKALQLPESVLGNISSSVQFGFIVGTLLFAFLAIADRFSPSKIFFLSSLFGGLANLAILFLVNDASSLLFFRFLTGFFLAGIYPIGMKISADWYSKKLGKALGYLVGALVLGTAFPHLLKSQTTDLPWQIIILTTSALAVLGGILLLFFVPDGPHRTKGAKFQGNTIAKIFKYKKFRSAAFGYFGHMWELYAFWTFIPILLLSYSELHKITTNISLWSFVIIAIGSLGCVLGGIWSQKWGSAKVAFNMLLVSGILCLISPFLFLLPFPLFILLLLVWGFAVVGDSAQFSTVVAQTAPKEYVGSALTIVNCIGFSITILSIELLNYLYSIINNQYLYLILAIGALFGLISIWKLQHSIE